MRSLLFVRSPSFIDATLSWAPQVATYYCAVVYDSLRIAPASRVEARGGYASHGGCNAVRRLRGCRRRCRALRRNARAKRRRSNHVGRTVGGDHDCSPYFGWVTADVSAFSYLPSFGDSTTGGFFLVGFAPYFGDRGSAANRLLCFPTRVLVGLCRGVEFRPWLSDESSFL